MKKKFSQKQIPTLIGIGVLVVAMVVGVLFLNKGLGVFAPRATPQTTPKLVKITNVKDTSFTVSFLTDESTVGFAKYGPAANQLKLRSSDDRDQLTGTVAPFTTHYVTIRDLSPSTTYYFALGTGSDGNFMDNGVPFSVKTTPKGNTPSAAKTAYGTVNDASGKPATGAIVYVDMPGAGQLSSLVKDSGSWAVPLSSARAADGGAYTALTDETMLSITVQGTAVASTGTAQAKVSQSQPVAVIALAGGAGGSSGSVATTPSGSPSPVGAPGCLPRPACLDSHPACAVAQPVQGWCPAGTGVAGSSGGSASSSAATTSTTSNEQASAAVNLLLGTNASGSTSYKPAPINNGGVIQGFIPGSLPPSPAVSSSLSSLTASPAAGRVVDLQSEAKQVVTTTQPLVIGLAPANVKVSLTIHSTNPVTTQVQADQTGSYSVDLASLQKNLAPGQHTATVTYTDPQTGKTITETKTFTVSASPSPSSNLVADASAGQPYGTSNPYPVSTDTPRASMPSTGSGVPTSGSTETTLLLLGGGGFLTIAGMWSYLMGRAHVRDVVEDAMANEDIMTNAEEQEFFIEDTEGNDI
jgi:hypothetical protein